MAEKYFAELERMWQQNRGSVLQRYFGSEFDFPRAKALRGPDLVHELVRLAALTRDMRFRDAVFALTEHGIVDRKFNFRPWEPQHLQQGREKLKLLMWANIHDLKSRYGLSLRRVCAELAAQSGWPATSFAAAVKDLGLLYRRRHFTSVAAAVAAVKELELLYRRRHLDPGGLEKSCRTSIPTTADN